GRARGEEHVQRASNVGLEVLAGVAGRDHDVARRAVQHDGVLPHDLLDQRDVADRPFDELEPGRRQVLEPAGEEVVQDRDVRAFLQEPLDDGAPHEARATGDEYHLTSKRIQADLLRRCSRRAAMAHHWDTVEASHYTRGSTGSARRRHGSASATRTSPWAANGMNVISAVKRKRG